MLLDAPCSSTGTIRRHPDIPWLKQPKDIATLAALQSRMLDRAAALVKPGGVLVYCTCSLEPEEGEEQVAPFLARHPEFAFDPIAAAEIAGLGHLLTADGAFARFPATASARRRSCRAWTGSSPPASALAREVATGLVLAMVLCLPRPANRITR